MCETSVEESNIFDNEACDFLDATMGVVADFASMLANGIYLFICFRYCPEFTFAAAYVSFSVLSRFVYVVIKRTKEGKMPRKKFLFSRLCPCLTFSLVISLMIRT